MILIVLILGLDSKEPLSQHLVIEGLREAGLPIYSISYDKKRHPHLAKRLVKSSDAVVYMGSLLTAPHLFHPDIIEKSLDPEKTARDFSDLHYIPNNVIAYVSHGGVVVFDKDADIELGVRGTVEGMSYTRYCKKPFAVIIHPEIYAECRERLVEYMGRLFVGGPSDERTDVIKLGGDYWFREVQPYIRTGERFGKIILGGGFNEPTIIEIDPEKVMSDMALYFSKETPGAVLNIIKGEKGLAKEVADRMAKNIPNGRILAGAIYTGDSSSYKRHLHDLKYSVHDLSRNAPTTWGLGCPVAGDFRSHEGYFLVYRLSTIIH